MITECSPYLKPTWSEHFLLHKQVIKHNPTLVIEQIKGKVSKII